MDTTVRPKNPNPRESANMLSVLFFVFVAPLFKLGNSKELEEADLYDPLPCDRSKILGDRLDAKWKLQLGKKHPNFLKAVLSTFRWEFIQLAVILGVYEVGLRVSQPLLLGGILEYFKPGSTMPFEHVIYYSSAMAGISLIGVFMMNHYLMFGFHLGMQIRVACCSVIYRKSLRLSNTAFGQTASGKIVNLLSNDVSRLDLIAPLMNYLWTSPAAALIILYFLWANAGYAGLIGMGVVFIVVPIQAYTGKLSSIFRLQTAYKTDERVRLMEEIITGVQVIKMYAWEMPFAKLVEYARRKELKMVRKSSYVRGLYMMFSLFTTRLAMFAAMVAMAMFDQTISADKIFVFSFFFSILSHTMSGMFVRGIAELAETIVALKRLGTFMSHDEYETAPRKQDADKSNGVPLKTYPSNANELAVSLVNMNAKWQPDAAENTLHNINLTIVPRKLVAIIGPVGSGKSSILQSLLGELSVAQGSVDVNGQISYACQEPWVFAASVRQNILFGQPYNKMRYTEVVRVCCLKKDFAQFPHGDMTMVGDRGASLSGGQKARINLARAVYRQADVYLLDDPLSAVDTHVGKQLFEICISEFLSAKTIILVTHQLQYLKDADHLIILKDGRIEMQGSFDEIINSDIDYAQMLTSKPEIDEREQQEELELSMQTSQRFSRQKSGSINSTSTLGASEIADIKAQQAEKSSKGIVKGSLLWLYVRAGGNLCLVLLMFLLFILTQTIASCCDYFVSYWTNDEEMRAVGPESPEYIQPTLSQSMEIYLFTALICALFLFGLLRSFFFYHLCLRSSQRLHDSMFLSMIQTKMRFFETNPTGRILNRFSKDIGAVDELLPKVLLDASQFLLIIVGAIIVSAIVNPYFLIPIFIIGGIFHFIKNIYLKTSKNVKRLEGITRSPVFSHLNTTMQGLTTIRAYNAQDSLRNEFDLHQDVNTGAWYMFISSSSCFGFILDLFCVIFITCVIFTFIGVNHRESTSAGSVGLAITQALSLTGLVQWAIRQTAEVQNQLMSVERVLEYSYLEPEPNLDNETSTPKEWPDKGRIQFDSTFMKYADDEPYVLNGLNVTIEPSEKIGIVGRTGAGKSSLISSLFRLALVKGNIFIDNINTMNIDLQTLRKRISIIPQDPVLFSGTMRRNLDPFENYSDAVLWSALQDVELKEAISSAGSLETRVMDHGSNFSVGQRQLVCLARAIIRNNKILVLDEATANVDPQTDALIQSTIRDKFANCTVLTVAHRLNTIMDSDKVLVMSAGRMVEFDHPHILCQNKSSHFYKMVEETGPAMTEQLCKVAKDSFEKTPRPSIENR